ncbi:MAG: hypothetical protein IPG84_07560 [Betaproteobacteria bacterium]|nr:hypothetical protein [Betaproteobacteria bacterium]
MVRRDPPPFRDPDAPCPAMRADLRAWGMLAAVGAMIAILTGVAEPAGAAIHKCAGADGATSYQDRPCGPSATPADFDGTIAPMSVLPSPPTGATVVRREPPARAARAERARRPETQRPGNPADRKHLRAGMSEGEVVARIGPPDLTTGKGRRLARWTWMPVPGDPDTITVVLFDVGRIVEIERTVVKR